MGTLKTCTGVSYWLEACGEDYVLKQFLQSDFPDETGIKINAPNGNVITDSDTSTSDNTTKEITFPLY